MMTDLGSFNLVNFVSLVYRVQEAYFHEWDIEEKDFSKKDI